MTRKKTPFKVPVKAGKLHNGWSPCDWFVEDAEGWSFVTGLKKCYAKHLEKLINK